MTVLQEAKKIGVLFLSANPDARAPIAIREEHDQIREELRSAEFRDAFELHSVVAANVVRLSRALLEHRPRVVHFSGHGSIESGLQLEARPGPGVIGRDIVPVAPADPADSDAHPLGAEPLARLLSAQRDHVQVVVLNACHTATLAEAIAREIDCVIGTTSAIGDDAARAFSVAFYQALANGHTVKAAFEHGCACLGARGFPDQDFLVLHTREGVDAATIVLAGRPTAGPLPPRRVVIGLSGERLKIHVHFAPSVTLGRSEENDVALKDAPRDIGNIHAQVTYLADRDAYEVLDKDSTHGTFVNGRNVGKGGRALLDDGDALRLGRALTLPVRRRPGHPDSCAALVHLDKAGREVDCLVIAPHDRVVLGNVTEKLPHPGESLGCLRWTPENIIFEGPSGSFRVEDDGEIALPHGALKFYLGGRPVDLGIGTEPPDSEPKVIHPAPPVVVPPGEGELPPRIRYFDRVLVVVATLAALTVLSSLVNPPTVIMTPGPWVRDWLSLLGGFFGTEVTRIVLTPPLIRLALVAAVVALARGGRLLRIGLYHRKRWAEYEAWQAERTREDFEAKRYMDEARRLFRAGDEAKALALLKEALKLRPSYQEAIELKRAILGGARAGAGGTALGEALAPPDVPELYLKILHTPYAYRAPHGFERITLGRQRGKAAALMGDRGGGEEVGNDLVIRVPGSDPLSLRISRRHLEIQRIDRQFYVNQLGAARTELNGRALVPEQPRPLVSGDRLTIAGVLALVVQLRTAIEGWGRQEGGNAGPGSPTPPDAPRPGRSPFRDSPGAERIVRLPQVGGAEFEATIGDMVTELPDD